MALTLDLKKGDAVLLRGDYKFNILMFGLGWDPRKTPGPAIDVDPMSFGRNSNGETTELSWCCYYKNLDTGWCLHSEDNTTGDGELDSTGDDERIWIDLAKVPKVVQSIDLVVNIFEAKERRLSFGDLSRGVIRLVNVPDMGVVEGVEKIRVELTADAYYDSTGFLAITLVRNGVSWEVQRPDLTDARWADTTSAVQAINKGVPTK